MNLLDFLHQTVAQVSTMPGGLVVLSKATLLLAVAWLIHFALAKANPRWRVLLWRGVAVGLLLQVVWTVGLPGYVVQVERPQPEPEAVAVLPSSVPAPPIDVVPERGVFMGDPGQWVEPVEMPVFEELTAMAPVEPIAVDVPTEAAPIVEAAKTPLPWLTILAVVWAVGVVLLVARTAVAYVRLLILLRNSQAAPDAVAAKVERIAEALGCRTAVCVRRSERFAVPFFYGLRRPTLVLPERMCETSYRSQLPAILAHELAHMCSRDLAWNAVVQAVSIVLWFHPLMWRISRTHQAACDRVADAVSADHVGDVQAYCQTLARVALEVGSLSASFVGLAMARHSDIRRRLALLQWKQFATPLKRRWVAVVGSVGLVVFGLLAGVRFVVAEAAPLTVVVAEGEEGEAKTPMELEVSNARPTPEAGVYHISTVFEKLVEVTVTDVRKPGGPHRTRTVEGWSYDKKTGRLTVPEVEDNESNAVFVHGHPCVPWAWQMQGAICDVKVLLGKEAAVRGEDYEVDEAAGIVRFLKDEHCKEDVHYFIHYGYPDQPSKGGSISNHPDRALVRKFLGLPPTPDKEEDIEKLIRRNALRTDDPKVWTLRRSMCSDSIKVGLGRLSVKGELDWLQSEKDFVYDEPLATITLLGEFPLEEDSWMFVKGVLTQPGRFLFHSELTEGTVKVVLGDRLLEEGVGYEVDYEQGVVTIIDKAIEKKGAEYYIFVGDRATGNHDDMPLVRKLLGLPPTPDKAEDIEKSIGTDALRTDDPKVWTMRRSMRSDSIKVGLGRLSVKGKFDWLECEKDFVYDETLATITLLGEIPLEGDSWMCVSGVLIQPGRFLFHSELTEGTVKVVLGDRLLEEGVGYEVDYEQGVVTIIDKTIEKKGAEFYIFAGDRSMGIHGDMPLVRKLLGLPPTPENEEPSQIDSGVSENANVRPMRIKVVDSEGNPIAGAGVTVRSSLPTHFVSANAEGIAEIEVPAAETLRLSITVWHDDYVTAGLRWPSGTPQESVPTEYTVTLQRGTVIGGVVHNEQGQPLADAKVTIRGFKSQPGEILEWSIDDRVRSDADGKWSSHRIPQDLEGCGASISVRPKGYVSQTEFAVAKLSLDELRAQTAVMVAHNGITVEGIVTDSDGKPVAGAVVMQITTHPAPGAPDVATTDQKGRYRLAGCMSNCTLVVAAEGHVANTRQVEVTEEERTFDLQLHRGEPIHLKVVDQDGKPIAGAAVKAVGSGIAPPVTAKGPKKTQFQAVDSFTYGMIKAATLAKTMLGVEDAHALTTDAEGRWSRLWIPKNELRLYIQREGFKPVRKSFAPDEQEQVVTLTASGWVVDGRVVDSQTKEPVTKFYVVEGREYDASQFLPGAGPFWPGRRVIWDGSRTVENEDGRYHRFARHTHPQYTPIVRIEAEGYLPSDTILLPSEGQVATFDVELTRGEPVTGVVLSAAGKPLANAEVLLYTASWRLHLENGHSTNRRHLIVHTQADGRFSFMPQREPCALVVLHDDGFARVEDEKDMKSITIQPWARVEGTLRTGSEPAAGQPVRLTPEWSFAPDAPSVSIRGNATTDEQGRFTFDRVFPGPGRIARSVKIEREKWISLIQTHSTDLTFVAGQTTQVELSRSGRPVKGKLIMPGSDDEAPLQNVIQAWLKVVSPSSVEIPAVPTIPWPADIDPEKDRDRAFAWWETWKDGEEGKRYLKQMELRQTIVQNNYYTRISAEVGLDGSFLFEDMPAGDYELEVRLFHPSEDNTVSVVINALDHEFTIPEMPGGRSDEPLDLGELTLSLSEE